MVGFLLLNIIVNILQKKSQNESVKMPSMQKVNSVPEVQGNELDSESPISSDHRSQEMSSQKRKVSDLLTQERVEKAGNILEKSYQS